MAKRKTTNNTDCSLNYLDDLFSFERTLWEQRINSVAGVDEAGRGPLAGPLFVSAVIFDPYLEKYPKVFDSKQISKAQRENLYEELINFKGLSYSVIQISPEEIDKINIFEAVKKAMALAVTKLPDTKHALIDGISFRGLPVPATFIVKGDAKSASIAASSIIAKVSRDRLMNKLAIQYPEYDFASHMGYGTKKHIEAIKKYGPCEIHRKSFEPIQSILRNSQKQDELF